MSPYQIVLNVYNQNHCIKLTCKYLKILASIYGFGVKNIQEFYSCCVCLIPARSFEKIVKYFGNTLPKAMRLLDHLGFIRAGMEVENDRMKREKR